LFTTGDSTSGLKKICDFIRKVEHFIFEPKGFLDKGPLLSDLVDTLCTDSRTTVRLLPEFAHRIKGQDIEDWKRIRLFSAFFTPQVQELVTAGAQSELDKGDIYIDGVHAVLRLVANGEHHKKTSTGTLLQRTIRMMDPCPEEKQEARNVQREIFEYMLKADNFDLQNQSEMAGKGPALTIEDIAVCVRHAVDAHIELRGSTYEAHSRTAHPQPGN
jgi:hypothetical protein